MYFSPVKPSILCSFIQLRPELSLFHINFIIISQHLFICPVMLRCFPPDFASCLQPRMSTKKGFCSKQITLLGPRPQFLFFTLYFICLRMKRKNPSISCQRPVTQNCKECPVRRENNLRLECRYPIVATRPGNIPLSY